jgi:alkanesulfonate monooxygenase SsuD/methylene tetrahydromethanopterin reductase-like flavin-dependent oxidoreductase (luciferase family)
MVAVMDDVTEPVRIGVLLPMREVVLGAGWAPLDLVDMAVDLERRGLASVWANDALDRPRIEALTALSAIAARTERITLGTAVLMPAYRQPLQTGQALASLDLLSGGRLVVGVGAGYPGFCENELAAVGVGRRDRFAYLDDIVAVWRRLWSGDRSAFAGAVLRYDWLPEVAAPVGPGGPPVWLGGLTPAALGRAGRQYDGWLPYPPVPEDYGRALAAVRAAAAGAGRPSAGVTPALFVTVAFEEDESRAAERLDTYCRAIYGQPAEVIRGIQAMAAGPPDAVAAALSRYVDAGARHLVVRPAALDRDDHARQLDGVAAVADAVAWATDPAAMDRRPA